MDKQIKMKNRNKLVIMKYQNYKIDCKNQKKKMKN